MGCWVLCNVSMRNRQDSKSVGMEAHKLTRKKALGTTHTHSRTLDEQVHTVRVVLGVVCTQVTLTNYPSDVVLTLPDLSFLGTIDLPSGYA